MYYGPSIMEKAGIKFKSLDDDESALLLNIPLGFFNFVGTIICILYIDKLGRRYILLRTLPLMAVSWFIAAVGMSLTGSTLSDSVQTAGGCITIFGICMFLLFYAIGIGSTPWAINSEIYPLHVIGTANSLAATTNWVTNAIVSEIFKLLIEISIATTVVAYCGLGLCGILGFIFTYYLIPETANKPIEQILKEILGEDKASRSGVKTAGSEEEERLT